MDLGEQAGLRAFAVRVGRDSEFGPGAHPLWVECDGVAVPVERVASSWREDERAGWRLKLADGSWWLLYHVPELDLWSGVRLASRSGPDPGDSP